MKVGDRNLGGDDGAGDMTVGHRARSVRFRALFGEAGTLREVEESDWVEIRSSGYPLEEWLAAPPTPALRGECVNGPRPCPHLRCSAHNGARGEALGMTCARDVDAEHPDGMTLEAVAAFYGVTRERIRQIETNALRKLHSGARRSGGDMRARTGRFNSRSVRELFRAWMEQDE